MSEPVRTLTGMLENPGELPMSRTIAVVNQKGGVGKTTTAVNFSASLASAGHRVLLVDFDAQGNASSGVGYSRGQIELSIYEALIGDVAFRDVVRPTQVDNLYLIPATRDLSGATVELSSTDDWHSRLQKLIATVSSEFDYIVIDTPPSLGVLTVMAMVAADGLIVPMQCEYYALEGLSALLSTIERVRVGLNPQLRIDGVLFCMFDPRPNLTHQVTREVKAHLGEKVFTTVIPRNIRLSECPSFGKPILLYDRLSRGCSSYMAMAQEFIQRDPGNPSHTNNREMAKEVA